MFRFTRKPSSGSQSQYLAKIILKCFNNSTFFNVVCISWKIKCWTLQVSTSGSVLHIVMCLRMNMTNIFKPFYANANHQSWYHSKNTHMKSKTSTATNVTANFQNNNIKKSKNSAINLFHSGGILYSIPKRRNPQ